MSCGGAAGGELRSGAGKLKNAPPERSRGAQSFSSPCLAPPKSREVAKWPAKATMTPTRPTATLHASTARARFLMMKYPSVTPRMRGPRNQRYDQLTSIAFDEANVVDETRVFRFELSRRERDCCGAGNRSKGEFHFRPGLVVTCRFSRRVIRILRSLRIGLVTCGSSDRHAGQGVSDAAITVAGDDESCGGSPMDLLLPQS